MLETERESVILGLQKIADTRSVSWWKRNVCLKASEMLRAVVDGRIENRRGHWIDAPALSEITCSVCGKTWNCCDNNTEEFFFCPACGAKMTNAEAEKALEAMK